MKFIKSKLSVVIGLSILLNSGCGEKKKSSNNEIESNVNIELEKSTETSESLSLEQLQKIKKEHKHITDKLIELSPITVKEVDSWMPLRIGPLGRTDYKTNTVPESFLFVNQATFKTLDSGKQLDIIFLDGAYEMGSNAISTFLNLEKIYKENTTKDGYQKIVKRNGTVFFQKYDNQVQEFFLQFVVKNRFLINIETKSITEQELWELTDAFNFENLPGI